MKKEQSNIEDPHQIMMEIIGRNNPKKKKKKKTKKNKKLVETDIDIFAEDEKEKQEN